MSEKEILINYFRAQEAAAVDALRQLGALEVAKPEKPNLANALQWVERTKQDGSGTYEVCLKQNYESHPAFIEFAEKIRKEGNPTLFYHGMVYWLFEASGDIGRKKAHQK